MPRQQNIKLEDYNRPLAKRLRSILKNRGLTTSELAKQIGATRQTISYYQNGDRVPDAYTLIKIAHALGVSSDYLLGLSNTESMNEDIQAAAKLTGLSGKAVEVLASIKAEDNSEAFYRALDMLIKSHDKYGVDIHPLTIIDEYANILTSLPEQNDILVNGHKIEFNVNQAICEALKHEFFDMIEDIYEVELWRE